MTGTIFLTTTLPYVNAAPHVGFALEAVQADVLARHHRRRGREVRLLTGTDDNSLKNLLAAEAAGLPVQEFVDRNAAAFEALREPLSLTFDDFIRTSTDPRHRAGVERLWRDCAADIYRSTYEGLYCVGCEHYLTDTTTCPDHEAPPQRVAEENWFFRLSRYAEPLREAITSGRLVIEPPARRNEVLALIDGGLRDFSISRSRERARGWGIEVPGDPGQVVYVWWDALGNYVTSLGYGTGGAAYEKWWGSGDGRRVHLAGKGVLRFHAVYWPALLLSAGLPLPTEILVHDYLTVDGRKISKSAGNGAEPADLAARYGTDALRWWLLREVPQTGDADFTVERLVARANEDLAGGAGNLVSRVVTLLGKLGGAVPGGEPLPVCAGVPSAVDSALAGFDFRRAAAGVWTIVEEANRYLEQTRPWELLRDGDTGAAGILGRLLATCRVLGRELEPFVPDLAAKISHQCTPAGGTLPPLRPVYPRLAVE
ncbi:methionine--tRNA ligase [Longispora albida]|uniref:methionine--tRNA ligase n=1 Tax=Longispora albida TaxID=203523 RepID=UPI00037078D9|nr:methionine--tRNA ligase [Longispora albida]